MSDSLDLSTKEAVLAWVSDTPYASVSAETLAGGYVNYTFRLNLKVPLNGRRTVVLKHGKSMTPGAWGLAFDVERQVYEVEAMKRVKALLPLGSLITIPEILRFDQEAHVIIMEDCEDSGSLRELLEKTQISPPEAERIGVAAGDFLRRLHNWDDEVLKEYFNGHAEGKRITTYVAYGRLVQVVTEELKKFKSPELRIPNGDLGRILQLVQERQKAILDARETFTMGDFWPGNVLVKLDDDGKVTKIFVVDFELAKTGVRGILYHFDRFTGHASRPTFFDVLKKSLKSKVNFGDLSEKSNQSRAGELNEMHFCPKSKPSVQAVMAGFIQEYLGGIKASKGLAETVLSHTGAHVVVISALFGSGGEEKIVEAIQDGVEMLLLRGEGGELRELLGIA